MPSDEHSYSLVVVMVGREDAGDGRSTREWLEQSSYNSCEAHDVFEAIEEMADFTMERRPEIIVLDADCCAEEAESVIHALEEIHFSDVPVSVLAVSEAGVHNTSGEQYQVTPGELPDQLEVLISHGTAA